MPDPANRAYAGTGMTDLMPPVNPFLGLLPQKYWNRAKDFFIYTLEWLPATLSTTTVAQTPIQSDSDFLVMAMTGKVTAVDDITAVAAPLPFLLTMEDGASGRIFSVGAQGATGVHWENMVGTSVQPFYLPYPKILKASGIITGKIQNFSATSRNVRLALCGFKIFPEGFQP